MKIVLLDAATLGADLDLSPVSELGEVVIFQSSSPDEVETRLRGADVVIVNKIKLNASNLTGNKTLKLICVAATGFDNIDIAFCKGNGIAVCNVVGYSTDSVAQLTVAMALYLADRLPEYTRAVRDGSYSCGNIANILSPVYHELAGKTWGIAGYGNIGKKVGKIADALGCKVIVYKRTPESGVHCVDLDTLCRESDILSVHLPLSDETKGIFDARHIAMLKRDCIFINVARGAVTDEKALAEAIKNDRIGGFATDVYSVEPFPKDHPFYEIRNSDRICFTPHMAWGSAEARVRCLSEMIQNIRSFRNGGRRNRVV